MYSYIFWDPTREIIYLPIIHIPIVWYGLFFALGFICAYFIFKNLLSDYIKTNYSIKESKQFTTAISDKLLFYVVIATIIGARLGHLIFYEKPQSYLLHPEEIFKIWQGGLASHGAAVAIILALYLFSFKKFNLIKLSFLTLLDMVSAPISLAAVFIRVGNFFNQEILGIPTKLPWGIIFGHPFDKGPVLPRHPVQLYEALFYLLTFFTLFYLSKKKLRQGRLIGLFLIMIFFFRFLIEFLKEEQSFLVNSNYLTMGQYLSIPFILLGCLLFFKKWKISAQ